MSPLTTDNRDMVEIETELRARIEVQKDAIARLERENARLAQENGTLRNLLGEAVGDSFSNSALVSAF